MRVLLFLGLPLLSAALPITLRQASSAFEASQPYNVANAAILTKDIPRFLEGDKTVPVFVPADPQPLMDIHLIEEALEREAASASPSAPSSASLPVYASEKRPIPASELMRHSNAVIQLATSFDRASSGLSPEDLESMKRPSTCSRHFRHMRHRPAPVMDIIVPATIALFILAVLLVEAADALWQRYKVYRIGTIRLTGEEAQLRAEKETISSEAESEDGEEAVRVVLKKEGYHSRKNSWAFIMHHAEKE